MDKNTFLINLSESDGTNFGRIDFAAQSESQKVFSAIWELEGQVNGGGFDQYFRTSEADVIAFAPIALDSIGARSCARIVRSAIALIPSANASSEEREEALDSLGDKDRENLESLDTEFFGYPDSLTDLLFAYVSKHPEDFGPVPRNVEK